VKEDAWKLGERNWRNAARNRDSRQKLKRRPWLRLGCCADDDDDMAPMASNYPSYLNVNVRCP
jgi:hypothetical protein